MLHKEEFSIDIAFEMVDVRRTGTLVLGDNESALRAAVELKNRGVEELILVTPDRSQDDYVPAESHYWHEETDLAEAARTMDGDIAQALIEDADEALQYLLDKGARLEDGKLGKTLSGAENGKTVQELLADEVNALGIEIYEGYQVLRYLVAKKHVVGVFLLNTKPKKDEAVYKVLLSDNVVIGTGGPTSVYLNTTYLTEMSGTFGLAILAGAKIKNAAEWRFGIAAKDFPLKFTGALMAALPRLYSVDEAGVEHDFLLDSDHAKRWPTRMKEKSGAWAFDVEQRDTTSAIDLLVKMEEERGRNVYADFNKSMGDAKATPVERLLELDADVYEECLEHGVDLKKDPLAIHIAAGHHIGGLEIDQFWQTSYEGLYAVGEAAAVYGGDHEFGKLSAGQIGALRAAKHIASTRNKGITKNHIDRPMRELVREFIRFAKAAAENDGTSALAFENELREKLSTFAALNREKGALQSLDRSLRLARRELETLSIDDISEQGALIHTLNTLYAQSALVFAALDLFEQETPSGMGSVYYDGHMESLLDDDEDEDELLVQVVWFDNERNERFESEWRELRPVPEKPAAAKA